MQVEYRVVPVTRFVVTRYHTELADKTRGTAGVGYRGEYANEKLAYEVAYALAETERQTLGYAIDDPRMKYPEQTNLPAPIEPGPIADGGPCNKTAA